MYIGESILQDEFWKDLGKVQVPLFHLLGDIIWYQHSPLDTPSPQETPGVPTAKWAMRAFKSFKDLRPFTHMKSTGKFRDSLGGGFNPEKDRSNWEFSSSGSKISMKPTTSSCCCCWWCCCCCCSCSCSSSCSCFCCCCCCCCWVLAAGCCLLVVGVCHSSEEHLDGWTCHPKWEFHTLVQAWLYLCSCRPN